MDKHTTATLVVSFILMALIRGLKEDLPRFKNIKGSFRALTLFGLASAYGLTDMMMTDGATFGAALDSTAKASGMGLALLLVEWIGGGTGGSGKGGGAIAPVLTAFLLVFAPELVAFTAIATLATACGMMPGGRSPAVDAGIAKLLKWEGDADAKLAEVQAMVDVVLANESKAKIAVQEKIDAVRAEIDDIRKKTEDVQALTDADLLTVFARFRQVWSDIEPLLKSLGVLGADGRLAAAGPGGAHPRAMPVPLALGRR